MNVAVVISAHGHEVCLIINERTNSTGLMMEILCVLVASREFALLNLSHVLFLGLVVDLPVSLSFVADGSDSLSNDSFLSVLFAEFLLAI